MTYSQIHNYLDNARIFYNFASIHLLNVFKYNNQSMTEEPTFSLQVCKKTKLIL